MAALGQLSIHTTYARVAVRSQDSHVEIHRQREPFHSLELPEVQLDTEAPTLRIDGAETRASLGWLTNAAFREESVRRAQEAAREGIARIVQEGDYLGDIADPGTSVAGLAEQQAADRPWSTLDVLNLELPRVAITPMQVRASYEQVGGVSPLYQWTPETEWTPSEFDVSLEPPGAVDIRYEGAPAILGGGAGREWQLSTLA